MQEIIEIYLNRNLSSNAIQLSRHLSLYAKRLSILERMVFH